MLEAFKAVAETGAASLGQIKFDRVVAIDGGGDGEGSVPRMMTAAPRPFSSSSSRSRP